VKRICNVCNELTDKLVKSKDSTDGVRSLCKDCFNKEQKNRRKAERYKQAAQSRAETLARQAQIAEEERTKALPFIARPRTFVREGKWDGSMGPVYYRNDGLKHIQSRGV